ncbi:unnamed protein product [Closterium sp. Naga37s-1]|nr:unnamed protein product [Closterium sp. Naga37s-1]
MPSFVGACEMADKRTESDAAVSEGRAQESGCGEWEPQRGTHHAVSSLLGKNRSDDDASIVMLPGVTGGLQVNHPLMLPASGFYSYLHSLDESSQFRRACMLNMRRARRTGLGSSRAVNATAACHDATRLPQLQPPGNTSSAQHAHSLTMPVHLLCTLAHEILDEARFTLYSVYEALGITLGRLVGVDQFGVQLEGLREQLEAARGELAAHKNLITRQAQELAAARGEVAEQSSRMLKVDGALEEALVSLARGDWGSTHTLNVS